jgi:hypothetical protein
MRNTAIDGHGTGHEAKTNHDLAVPCKISTVLPMGSCTKLEQAVRSLSPNGRTAKLCFGLMNAIEDGPVTLEGILDDQRGDPGSALPPCR